MRNTLKRVYYLTIFITPILYCFYWNQTVQQINLIFARIDIIITSTESFFFPIKVVAFYGFFFVMLIELGKFILLEGPSFLRFLVKMMHLSVLLIKLFFSLIIKVRHTIIPQSRVLILLALAIAKFTLERIQEFFADNSVYVKYAIRFFGFVFCFLYCFYFFEIARIVSITYSYLYILLSPVYMTFFAFEKTMIQNEMIFFNFKILAQSESSRIERIFFILKSFLFFGLFVMILFRIGYFLFLKIPVLFLIGIKIAKLVFLQTKSLFFLLVEILCLIVLKLQAAFMLIDRAITIFLEIDMFLTEKLERFNIEILAQFKLFRNEKILFVLKAILLFTSRILSLLFKVCLLIFLKIPVFFSIGVKVGYFLLVQIKILLLFLIRTVRSITLNFKRFFLLINRIMILINSQTRIFLAKNSKRLDYPARFALLMTYYFYCIYCNEIFRIVGIVLLQIYIFLIPDFVIFLKICTVLFFFETIILEEDAFLFNFKIFSLSELSQIEITFFTLKMTLFFVLVMLFLFRVVKLIFSKLIRLFLWLVMKIRHLITQTIKRFLSVLIRITSSIILRINLFLAKFCKAL